MRHDPQGVKRLSLEPDYNSLMITSYHSSFSLSLTMKKLRLSTLDREKFRLLLHITVIIMVFIAHLV